MAGEAKRDYPSPIDQHAPWYKEYKAIEDYFARLNLFLTKGTAVAHVAVIHPIESYWCLMGPDDKTAMKRAEMERHFKELTEYLLFGHIDFDFISESQIPDLYDGKNCFGHCVYNVILIPELLTIRNTTLDMLKSFNRHGNVAFIGHRPKATECCEPYLDRSFDLIPFTKESVLNYLEKERDVEILDKHHMRRDDLIYQLRKDGESRYLFIAHGKKRDRNETSNIREEKTPVIEIQIKGKWQCTVYDAMNGTKNQVLAAWRNGWTYLEHTFYEDDSLLIKLDKPKNEHQVIIESSSNQHLICSEQIRKPSSYSLVEDNVLLLDIADYYLNGNCIGRKEEILRIDDRIREIAGYAKRTEAFPQPWLYQKDNKMEHSVKLAFSVYSDINTSADIATEMTNSSIHLNGIKIEKKRLETEREALYMGRKNDFLSLSYPQRISLIRSYLDHVLISFDSVSTCAIIKPIQ